MTSTQHIVIVVVVVVRYVRTIIIILEFDDVNNAYV